MSTSVFNKLSGFSPYLAKDSFRFIDDRELSNYRNMISGIKDYSDLTEDNYRKIVLCAKPGHISCKRSKGHCYLFKSSWLELSEDAIIRVRNLGHNNARLLLLGFINGCHEVKGNHVAPLLCNKRQNEKHTKENWSEKWPLKGPVILGSHNQIFISDTVKPGPFTAGM